jgi:putative aldouronate transport system permease protein
MNHVDSTTALASVDTSAFRQAGLWQRMKIHRHWYLFVLPALVFYFVFQYWPMYYVQIAFRSYRITRSVWDSPWVGLEHFRSLFSSAGFLNALRNTIILGFYRLVFQWPVPIILALLLNEIRSGSFKRVTQTIIYLPHFVSWVIVGGIMINLLGFEGVFNWVRALVGRPPILFLASEAHFRPIIVLSDIWKSAGWGTIIYLASITRIPLELYEAAHIDGARRLQQMRYITLPGIADVVVVLLILRLGNILMVNFQQLLVLGNPMVRSVGDVIQTYVYRVGLLDGRFAFAAAAGLFNTVVASLMIFLADRAAKALGQRGLF